MIRLGILEGLKSRSISKSERESRAEHVERDDASVTPIDSLPRPYHARTRHINASDTISKRAHLLFLDTCSFPLLVILFTMLELYKQASGHTSHVLSLPPKYLAAYSDFIIKNSSAVSQIESALRSLTYIIPGEHWIILRSI
jgi:hypothetical protein